MDTVIAIDSSTTATKAVAYRADGTVAASASVPHPSTNPRPGWHEQDPDDWWAGVRGAVSAVVAQLENPARVRALAITHQRETFVCTDAELRPLRPAVLWMDARAGDQIARYGSAAVHRLSGKPPDTTPSIYKLAWLREHEPAVLRAAERVGDVQAVLAARLTGRWATSTASADTLGLFDLAARSWDAALLEVAGVRENQLPDLVPTGDVIAPLLPGVAGDLGLPPETPLVAGLGDGQSAGLALGADEPGVAYLNLGTSAVMGVNAAQYRWDAGVRTLDGMRPGTYTLESVLNAASYLASWCRREFMDGIDVAEAESRAALIEPGAEGLLVLPYWNAAQTPWWDPTARGAVVGWHGRHTAAHLYRACLEGVAFELAEHVVRLESATGVPIRVVRAVGGGSRSALWTAIVAAVVERPLHVFGDVEASAAGAGQLALEYVAGGSRPSLLAAGGTPVPVHDDLAARYRPFTDAQRELYPGLRGVFARLAAVEREAPTPDGGLR